MLDSGALPLLFLLKIFVIIFQVTELAVGQTSILPKQTYHQTKKVWSFIPAATQPVWQSVTKLSLLERRFSTTHLFSVSHWRIRGSHRGEKFF
jgi:hypothetical protein